MILFLYRLAWEPLLVIARLFAARERLCADRPEIGDIPQASRPTLWLHAASLGECKGLWTFAHTLWSAEPRLRIVFTANTTAGLGFLRDRLAAARASSGLPGNGDRGVARLAPIDHPRVAARFLRAFDVRAVVLFEMEIWPHWIRAAGKEKGAGVPVFWISARMTERARRRYAGNRPFAAALRRVLGGIAWTQAQSEDEAAQLRALGAPRVETGGDLRGLHYPGSPTSSRPPGAPDPYHPLHPDKPRRGVAFVSLHAQELPVIVPILAAGRMDEPVTVFPRKPKELPAFRKALEPLGFVLHSERPDAQRVIVDSFGRVTEALERARVAVIGGSFLPHDKVGGHNLWEPLLAGAPMVIGPRHGNQLYLARRLAEAGLLRVARNRGELSEALNARTNITAAAVGSEGREDPAEARKIFIANERIRLQRAAERAAAAILASLK